MKKEKKKVNDSVLLRCVHYRLLSSIDAEGRIRRRDVFKILGIMYHIPKESRQSVVNELQSYGMILEADKVSFKINKEF